MSSGLTHIGAIARGLAYAPVQARVSADAGLRQDPASGGGQGAASRQQTPDPVVTARGLDPLTLYKLAAQDRIRAEIAMMVDTVRQDMKVQNQQRADIRATGTLVDIRV